MSTKKKALPKEIYAAHSQFTDGGINTSIGLDSFLPNDGSVRRVGVYKLSHVIEAHRTTIAQIVAVEKKKP